MLKTILVGSDGSPTAAKAVDLAVDLAACYGARLVAGSCFVPVAEDRLAHEQRDAPAEIQWSINPMENADAILRDVEERATARGVRVTSEARMGKPANVLCDLAEEHDADVLVVGNQGMNRRLRGSVPNWISHHAPCSVLIVKTDA